MRPPCKLTLLTVPGAALLYSQTAGSAWLRASLMPARPTACIAAQSCVAFAANAPSKHCNQQHPALLWFSVAIPVDTQRAWHTTCRDVTPDSSRLSLQGVRYCGRSCQGTHWQEHKTHCRKASPAAAAAAASTMATQQAGSSAVQDGNSDDNAAAGASVMVPLRDGFLDAGKLSQSLVLHRASASTACQL